jgi:hypothetical protein
MNKKFQLIKSLNVSAKTVLYTYCKAVHGNLASEDAGGSVWQYERFHFDDDKVPLVVIKKKGPSCCVCRTCTSQ